MMIRIELRSSNVPLSEPLREHVARRLDFALRRFANRVESIRVRLVDLNGPKGGPDKRCRITLQISPKGSVIAEATDADAYVAVSQAAMRIEERVVRKLSQQRQQHSHEKRRTRPRPPLGAGTRARARRGVERRRQEQQMRVAREQTELP